MKARSHQDRIPGRFGPSGVLKPGTLVNSQPEEENTPMGEMLTERSMALSCLL